jgi:glycosyl hydrolase family 43
VRINHPTITGSGIICLVLSIGLLTAATTPVGGESKSVAEFSAREEPAISTEIRTIVESTRTQTPREAIVLETVAPDPVVPMIVPDERVFAVDSAGERFFGADPDLVRDGAVWRVFTTQTFWSTVPAWESKDMVTWTKTADAMPTLPAWARAGQTWAPDVVELDGRWVLFFSALYGNTDLHCIGSAVASTAGGPYQPSPDPIVCELDEGGSIDPMVFIDSDGDPTLLWKVDANAIGRASVLRSQPLSADGTELLSTPTDLLSYEPGWEYPLIEQPELVELDGVLHLFYAAGWWNQDTYQVGHAICETAAGPCTRTTTDGGWITSAGGVDGPGALSVAMTAEGPVGVYHAWLDGMTRADGDFRSLVVEPFALGQDGPARR